MTTALDTSHAGLSSLGHPDVCGFTPDWREDPISICGRPATHRVRSVKVMARDFAACPEHVAWMQEHRPENVQSVLPLADAREVGERLADFLEDRGYACPNVQDLGATAIEAVRASVEAKAT